MGLRAYRQKRHFAETPEPADQVRRGGRGALRFVVQRHEASRLHYDFRLEAEGVLKSWAVPKGPSLNPADKRLAVQVEDHPYDYRTFEGVIPKGNYGAGTVIVWDEGTYEATGTTTRATSEAAVLEGLRKGNLKLVVHGQKLKGEFALVQTKSRDEKNWLLIKKRDEYATDEDVTLQDRSVRTGRTNEEVGANKKAKGKRKAKPSLTLPARGATAKKSVPRMRRSTGPVAPMLATLVEEPFDRAGWYFEIKWDGYRAIAEVDHGRVKLYSRNHKSFVKRYDEIVESLKTLPVQAVLDGEIVVVDAEGRAQFQLLQNYGKSGQGPLLYYVFDLLELNGQDLRAEPLRVRRKKLARVIGDLPNIKISDFIEEKGKAYYQAAAKLGIEGIVAKNASSPYVEGGRSAAWLKIKTQQGQEAVIAGFTQPRGTRSYLGSLVLGLYEGDELVYIGHTGGGFNQASLAEIYQRLLPLVRPTSPFKRTPKTNMPVRWVEPKLVCNVKFQEWTGDGRMRQPIFLGLREDKPAHDVRREVPAWSPRKNVVRAAHEVSGRDAVKPRSAAKTMTPSAGPTLTNLDKIYFPEDGITKGDIIAYYRDVAPVLLPYLQDRPMNLNRHPNGIHQKNFYQKNIGRQHPPDFVATIPVKSDSRGEAVEYLLCQNVETLLYVANLGCIELNPWNARQQDLDRPDYLIFDLDPVELHFTEVVTVAQAFRKLLEKLGIEGVCKTSGKRGMHIYLPLGAQVTHEQGRDFAEILARRIAAELPALTSLERSPAKRRGRVYLDILQNRQAQSLVAAYSVRPHPGATVSTPLKWSEVTARLDPGRFTIKTTQRRLDQVGDLWQPVLGPGIDLIQALKRLES